jgi:hypothetical protein
LAISLLCLPLLLCLARLSQRRPHRPPPDESPVPGSGSGEGTHGLDGSALPAGQPEPPAHHAHGRRARAFTDTAGRRFP